MPEKTQKFDKNILVSVITCTYNRGALFKKFLESFFNQEGDFTDCELITVDNNSNDNTRELCEEYGRNPKIRTKYVFEKKQGLSYARNTAVKNASGELLAFIDDDVNVDKRWLAMVKKLVNSYQEFIAFGGKVIPLWERDKPSWVVFEGEYSVLQSVFPSHDFGDEIREYPVRNQKNPMGANMMLRKKCFEKYGFFRDDLGVSGSSLKTGGLHEDTEFIRRMYAEGEKALYYPLAKVSHNVPEKRMSKAYVRQWYFKSGGSFARMKHNYYDKQDYARFFGIPRWVFRKLIEPIFWMVFSSNPEKRFFYQLRLFRLFGSISEFINHSKLQKR